MFMMMFMLFTIITVFVRVSVKNNVNVVMVGLIYLSEFI